MKKRVFEIKLWVQISQIVNIIISLQTRGTSRNKRVTEVEIILPPIFRRG